MKPGSSQSQALNSLREQARKPEIEALYAKQKAQSAEALRASRPSITDEEIEQCEQQRNAYHQGRMDAAIEAGARRYVHPAWAVLKAVLLFIAAGIFLVGLRTVCEWIGICEP